MISNSAIWQTASQTWSHSDLTLVSGVLCGALVFLLRSHEPSWPRKLLYFLISIVGGVAMAPLTQDKSGLPEWPAAFLSSAVIVTLAIVVLDWSENAVPDLLTQAVQRLIGGKQAPQDPLKRRTETKDDDGN